MSLHSRILVRCGKNVMLTKLFLPFSTIIINMNLPLLLKVSGLHSSYLHCRLVQFHQQKSIIERTLFRVESLTTRLYSR